MREGSAREASSFYWRRSRGTERHGTSWRGVMRRERGGEGLRGCVWWHWMAAEKGYAEAQNAMAELHRSGTGVEKNLVEALTLHELISKEVHTQSRAQMEKIQVLKCVPPRTSRVDEGWSEHHNTAWNLMFDGLRKFKDREGHCNVPQRYSDIPELGTWVKNQRAKGLKISKERASKLDPMGLPVLVCEMPDRR